MEKNDLYLATYISLGTPTIHVRDQVTWIKNKIGYVDSDSAELARAVEKELTEKGYVNLRRVTKALSISDTLSPLHGITITDFARKRGYRSMKSSTVYCGDGSDMRVIDVLTPPFEYTMPYIWEPEKLGKHRLVVRNLLAVGEYLIEPDKLGELTSSPP